MFFNKKEDVLNFELTLKGREKLAEGDFNPEYYTFSDVDILYVSSSSELQNNRKSRIKNNHYLTSLNQDNIPALLQKEYTQREVVELGSNDLSQNKPAWKIKFSQEYDNQSFSWYDNNINGNEKNNFNNLENEIPQFNFTIEYVYKKNLNNDGNFDIYLKDGEKNLFIELEEINSFLDNESEFEVEFYDIVYNSDNKFNLKKMENPEELFDLLFDDDAKTSNQIKEKNIYGNAIEEEEC